LIAPADEKFPSLFVCEIFLKNLGKTAARDVSVKAKETSGPEGYGDRADILANFQDKFLLNQFKVSGTDNPVIVPKNPVPKVLAPNSASPVPFRLTCAAPKVYPGGLQWMNYMIGRVDYCDQFKVKHWLKFCFYVVNARGEVWACQAGNDEDRNTETTVPETTCDNPG
jgi:hypothetical protein